MVIYVTEEHIGLETEIKTYISFTAQEMKDSNIDFVHKDSWVRTDNRYFKN